MGLRTDYVLLKGLLASGPNGTNWEETTQLMNGNGLHLQGYL